MKYFKYYIINTLLKSQALMLKMVQILQLDMAQEV